MPKGKRKKSLVGWTDKDFFSLNVDKICGEIYLNGIFKKQEKYLKGMYHPKEPIKVRITIQEV